MQRPKSSSLNQGCEPGGARTHRGLGLESSLPPGLRSPPPRPALGSCRHALSVPLTLTSAGPPGPRQGLDSSFHPRGAQMLSTGLVFSTCKLSLAPDHKPCQPATWYFQGPPQDGARDTLHEASEHESHSRL